jgi:hypothetical protein
MASPPWAHLHRIDRMSSLFYVPIHIMMHEKGEIGKKVIELDVF